MAKIKKINNIANEEILPVTHSDAVIVDETNLTTKLGEMMQVELSESDPGEGEPLEDGKFIAVYGEAEQVATSDIKDNAVTESKINNGAVTENKLGNGAVSGDKIKASAVKSSNMGCELPMRVVFDGGMDARSGVTGGNRLNVSASPTLQNNTYCQRGSDGNILIKKAGYYLMQAQCRASDSTNNANIAYNFTTDGGSGDRGGWYVKNGYSRISFSAIDVRQLAVGDKIAIAVYVDGSAIGFGAGTIRLIYLGKMGLEDKE